MIYLDNAATTRIDDRVLEAMMPYLTDKYGNAGSLYRLGRESADAVGKAREQVANLIGAKPKQIIFTSGGSEANNLALKGIDTYNGERKKYDFLISNIEHESMIEAANDFEQYCHEQYRYYPGDDLELLSDFFKSHKYMGFVSTMWVNNETGYISPIKDIAKHCHNNGALFHSDCVQALDLFNEKRNAQWFDCDFISMSSHKIHGPKGCGALYCKDSSILTPLINGGSFQEFGKRGGTEAVANIVGFGKACEILKEEPELDYISNISSTFKCVLYDSLDHYGILNLVSCNRQLAHHPKIFSFTFKGIDSETLVLFADSKGVCISSGSACAAHEQKPSHVLLAMGLSEEEARSTIRVSFSRMNTEEEVIEGAEIVAECVKILSEAG